jgi:hypothetical protein
MVNQYGSDLAHEFAMGYATGFYFEQYPASKRYWREVVAEIDKHEHMPKPAPKPYV